MVTKKCNYKDLQFGEIYISTKSHSYSNYSGKWEKIEVPEGEKLLFRSFQPYGNRKDQELALFFWMKLRITVCLAVSEETPILYLEHIDWEKRNENETTQEDKDVS